MQNTGRHWAIWCSVMKTPAKEASSWRCNCNCLASSDANNVTHGNAKIVWRVLAGNQEGGHTGQLQLVGGKMASLSCKSLQMAPICVEQIPALGTSFMFAIFQQFTWWSLDHWDIFSSLKKRCMEVSFHCRVSLPGGLGVYLTPTMTIPIFNVGSPHWGVPLWF